MLGRRGAKIQRPAGDDDQWYKMYAPFGDIRHADGPVRSVYSGRIRSGASLDNRMSQSQPLKLDSLQCQHASTAHNIVALAAGLRDVLGVIFDVRI